MLESHSQPGLRFCLLLLVSLVGGSCSMVLHHPAPSGREGAPWNVRCESVQADVVNAGEQARGAKRKGWVYAQSPAGFEIQVLGRLEDGFVHVDDVLSADTDWQFDWDAPYQQQKKRPVPVGACAGFTARKKDLHLFGIRRPPRDRTCRAAHRIR